MVKSVTPAGRLSGHRLGKVARARVLLCLAVGLPATIVAGWQILHRVPGLAPWAADTLRSIVGVDAVARLEEFAYRIEDRVLTLVRRGEQPRAYWRVPPEATPPNAAPAPSGPGRGAEGADPALPAPELLDAALSSAVPFHLASVGPMHAGWAAPGDGAWVPLPEGTDPRDARMFKTLLHPDRKRGWAELFVVALDLRRVRMHLVPGTREPQATVTEALDIPRLGRVPDEHHAGVLAAFNGGFKTEHGHYGMFVNGVTLVPPHQQTCTVAYFKDHTLRIGSWPTLQDQLDEVAWWRQTPNCMFEGGRMHPRLADGYVHKWGSTLGGETVIRRSAIGIDASGHTLFVGISNHTTAPAIASGMRHAGALTVAQLDINFSYPKFVTFRASRLSKLRFAVPLARGFEFSEHEYLRKPSYRDFFYVMDAAADGRTARN